MKTMHRALVTLWVSLAALLCVGCAANEARQQAAYARDIQRTMTALIAAGDADSLAAASVMAGWKKDSAERLTLIARAVASAPDRPDLVWLNLQLCSAVESCDPIEWIRMRGHHERRVESDASARLGRHCTGWELARPAHRQPAGQSASGDGRT
jgi:hypothetical protein